MEENCQLDFYKMLGQRIKLARTELKMRQKMLALKIGLNDQSQISRWESGEREVPVKELIAISKVLGKSVDYFLEGDQASNKVDRTDSLVTQDDPIYQNQDERLALHLCSTLGESGNKRLSSADEIRSVLLKAFLSVLENDDMFKNYISIRELQETLFERYHVSFTYNGRSSIMEALGQAEENAVKKPFAALIAEIAQQINLASSLDTLSGWSSTHEYSAQRWQSELRRIILDLRLCLRETGFQIGQCIDTAKKEDFYNEILENEEPIRNNVDFNLLSSFRRGFEEGSKILEEE